MCVCTPHFISGRVPVVLQRKYRRATIRKTEPRQGPAVGQCRASHRRRSLRRPEQGRLSGPLVCRSLTPGPRAVSAQSRRPVVRVDGGRSVHRSSPLTLTSLNAVSPTMALAVRASLSLSGTIMGRVIGMALSNWAL